MTWEGEWMKNKIKNWFNKGTKQEIFIKKAMIVLLTIYFLYRSGYVVGTFLAHLGL